MTKACLAIAVGDAPPLDYLRGAINGAHALAKWAEKQGYDTRLLTDEQEKFGFDEIETRLTDLLSAVPERLIIYFAGHGMAVPGSVANDLWLLSRWNRERKGVSVNDLRVRLRRYGIGQLVIISDACRLLPSPDTTDVLGESVLDRGDFDPRVPQIDTWFSASEYRAAWMIPGRKPEEDRCIFSGLLAEALDGMHAEAFDSKDPSRDIISWGFWPKPPKICSRA